MPLTESGFLLVPTTRADPIVWTGRHLHPPKHVEGHAPLRSALGSGRSPGATQGSEHGARFDRRCDVVDACRADDPRLTDARYGYSRCCVALTREAAWARFDAAPRAKGTQPTRRSGRWRRMHQQSAWRNDRESRKDWHPSLTHRESRGSGKDTGERRGRSRTGE
jgi:hypothetical protein